MATNFGNYEILRKLAAGGMAEILLAKQKSLGGFERLVCIKRILPHLCQQEDFISMFQDEARIVANLNHPNIAQIYEIGFADESYYIAMEYVRGEDLRRVYNQEVTRGRAMPLEPAAHIIMGAAAGLDFAHRQTTLDGRPLGIVHRDVSPQNILVTYDGHVKLVDFGVAKAEGKLTETRSGVLKGKYSYMSPEQASGDPIDGRTDVFALGITLYEVTTGVRLFKRESEIETLHAVIECNVTPPSDLVPGYDPELQEIVLRALAHDPDDRFATAGEMERAVEQFLVKRAHPTGASSLAAYMQELFAEKLADEVLFGGPSWSAEGTPANRHESKTSTVDEEPGPRRSSSHTAQVSRAARSAARPSAATVVEGSERTDKNGGSFSDPTTVEESKPGAKSSRSNRVVPWRGAGDWATEAESVSRTVTHDSIERPLPAQLTPLAPPVSKRVANATRLLPAVAAATLMVTAAVTVALAITRPWKAPEGPSRSGVLVIDSEPRGARVVFVGPGADEINRRYTSARTPFNIAEGLPVKHQLKLQLVKDGYEIAEPPIPELQAGVVPPPIFVELPPGPEGAEAGALVLLSTPPGAEIWLDGKRIEGKTPQSDLRVRGGQMHRIEFRLAGHKSRAETVFVDPGGRRFIELPLEEERAPSLAGGSQSPSPRNPTTHQPAPAGKNGPAYLTVTAPMKLEVTLDNKSLGETPIRKVAVEPGSRRLRLESESEGFVVRRKVRFSSGQTEVLELKPKKGTLSVNASPWAWVQIGKSKPSETPLRLQLYEGEYEVKFECPDGQRKSEPARVTAGETTSLSVSCR